MPVHVRKKDRPRLNHFENSQAAPDADVGIRQFRFGRPNVFAEPFAKFHVVSKAAQQAHRRMRMAIVKRGHNCEMRTIDNLCAFVIGRFQRTRNLFKKITDNQDIALRAIEENGF